MRVFPYGKPEYAALASSDGSNLKPRLIEYDNIRTSLQAAGGNYTSLSDRIFDVLTHQGATDECVIVRIEDLYGVFREAIFSRANDEIWSESAMSHQNPLMKIAIDRATDSARSLLENCLERYKENGKLDAEICNNWANALMDMLKDCADGGPAVSYFEYVRQYLQNLDHDRYRIEYRTRFEYLAEQVQKEFFMALKKELGV